MSPILFFIIFFICTGVGKIFLQINSAAVAFIDILKSSVRRVKMLAELAFIVLRPKKIYDCVFQVSALKKLGMVGQHNMLFYKNMYYRYCIFHYMFLDFFSILTVFSSKVTKKWLGSGQKPRYGWET